jgi:NTE family protein
MKRPLALVLGGGGARGAFQVGALRALLEADIRPDLLVGTSIGALNATYLALHGFTAAGLDALAVAWHEAAEADLLPSNYLWLTTRTLFNRAGWHPNHRLHDFVTAHGVSPGLRFMDLPGARLILVSADLNSGRPVLYGVDSQQPVLEGLLASTALPPWMHPLEKGRQFLMDGGVVSNLPIEPALAQGAREIIALDLSDSREVPVDEHGFGPFLSKMLNTVEQRQLDLELALARANGVAVHRVPLQGEAPHAIWDFQHPDALIARGYALTRTAMAAWDAERPHGWRAWWRFHWAGGMPERQLDARPRSQSHHFSELV